MPNHDRRLSAIAEAEWHVTAAECRLLLALRDRTDAELGLSGSEAIDGLFDDLGQALARLRDALREGAPPSSSPPPDRADASAAPSCRGGRNSSFTASRQCAER